MTETQAMAALLRIMATLRDPDIGCSWDQQQTFATIAPYTIEEAYEVADAIRRADMDDLRDELGDLLLQVIYHSQIASELHHFTFVDVVERISDKMVRRHPHVFDIDASKEPADWEKLKARERSAQGFTSEMDGVAASLPSLTRSRKIQERAARCGFDWPDAEGPLLKLHEELEEFANASDPRQQHEEAGDILFSAVNFLRRHGIDAEAALRDATAKFERRFKAMEKMADGRFADLKLDEQETLWTRVKRDEAESRG